MVPCSGLCDLGRVSPRLSDISGSSQRFGHLCQRTPRDGPAGICHSMPMVSPFFDTPYESLSIPDIFTAAESALFDVWQIVHFQHPNDEAITKIARNDKAPIDVTIIQQTTLSRVRSCHMVQIPSIRV